MMRWLNRVGWRGVTGAALWLVACGGSDDDDPSPAQAKCEGFADAWCGRALNCYVEVGRLASAGLADQLAACKRVAVAAVPCEKAVDVGPSYESCISEINAMSCERWDVPVDQLPTIQPPASCTGVIKVAP